MYGRAAGNVSARRGSFDGVGGLLFAEEIFAGLLRDQPGVFELEVGALDFAAVDGELGGERGGGGERVAGGELFVSDERLDLLADLQVVRAFGSVFEADVHQAASSAAGAVT